jgi:hypothetical protein
MCLMVGLTLLAARAKSHLAFGLKQGFGLVKDAPSFTPESLGQGTANQRLRWLPHH